MLGKDITSLYGGSSGGSSLRMMRLALIFALFAAFFIPAGFAEQISGHDERDWNDTSDSSSSDNSSIRFASHSGMIKAPVSMSVGSGYYSSHPILYDSGMGRKTQLVDTGSATYLIHEIDSADKIEGESEFSAAGSSHSWDDSNFQSTATTHMKIDENVTDGKVHIGVFKANTPPEGPTGNERERLQTNAWKHPSIEIEEDYIGTYHIYKNITIGSSYGNENRNESWLNCCGGDYEIYRHEPAFISADQVFNCQSGCKISNPSISSATA
jgi:hypothetical protein